MASDVATSMHRMPAVSASQALQKAGIDSPRPISFGLKALDHATNGATATSNGIGGLPRGRVTELYGPPGVGKSTLCMQACASCLLAGGSVTWIDADRPLVPARMVSILDSTRKVNQDNARNESTLETPTENLMEKLIHYDMPALAHFLALILHPLSTFAEHSTELVVIDSLATLVDAAYPRSTDTRSQGTQKDRSMLPSNRRQAVIATIASKLTSLAAVKDIVILVNNPVVTRIRRENTALLNPALSGQDWESATLLRIALFRDWAQSTDRHEKHTATSARFARIVKRCVPTGSTSTSSTSVVAFNIDQTGAVELPSIEIARPRTSRNPNNEHQYSHKRRFSQVAASEAEDDSDSEYGWVEDDVQLAAEGLVDESCLAGEHDHDPAPQENSDGRG